VPLVQVISRGPERGKLLFERRRDADAMVSGWLGETRLPRRRKIDLGNAATSKCCDADTEHQHPEIKSEVASAAG
jgi:hypothetical protein